MVAKDNQLTSRLVGIAPFGYSLANLTDSLTTMASGTIKMDTLAAQMAFCTADDPIAHADADQLFHYGITNLVFPDASTENTYFEKLRLFYIFNHDKWKDVAQHSAGNTCSPCDTNYRMHLKLPPLIPQEYNPDGSLASGQGSFLGQFPDSLLADISYYGQNGTTISDPDSVAMYQDSAAHTVHAADSLLSHIGADSIVAHLVTCFPDTTRQARMRDTLIALFNRGEVHNGQYTPNQVRYAITASGNSLGDLCQPYMYSYDYFHNPGSGSGSCKSDAFYQSIADLLNDGTIRSALTSVNTTALTTSYTLPTGIFSGQIATAVGSSSVTLTTRYDAASYTYRLTFAHSSASVTIALRSPGTTPVTPMYYGAGSLSFTGADCYFANPSANAPGHIGSYMFRAQSLRTDGSTQTTTSIDGWTDGSIPTTEEASNQLEACVPPTQFKALYKQFADTMATYNSYFADHPLFYTSLQHFANFYLRRSFGQYQYQRFLQSCALADSMLIPMYGAYAEIYGSDADVDGIISTAATAGLTLNPLIRFRNSSGGVVVDTMRIDCSSIPWYQLGTLKSIIMPGGSTTHGNMGVAPQGDTVGYIVLADANNVAGFMPPGLQFGAMKSGALFYNGAWTAGYSTYKYTKTSTATPQQLMRALYTLDSNIYAHGYSNYTFLPYYLSTINQDYYKPQKQAYLNYVYSAQQLSTPRVLDTVQDFMVQSLIPAFGGNQVSYAAPGNAGNVTDLYYTSSANTYPGYTTLQNILSWSQSTLGSSALCMAGTVNTVPGGTAVTSGALTLYRCADGLYWYRYFDASNKLCNVYLRIPAYIPEGMHPSLHPVGMQLATGDSTVRAFTLLLTSSSLPATDTIRAAGTTDFNLAWSGKLRDVLLGDEETHQSSPTPLSGQEGSTPNCEQELLADAITNAKNAYWNYIDSMRSSLDDAFYAHVLAQTGEHLFVQYLDRRFAWTLYHYDLAGNMIKSVPPEGVHPLSGTPLAGVDALRSSNGFNTAQIPAHTKASTYEFSTANQPLRESTPDGGMKDIYYDAKGNVILSQNANQRPLGLFTYTLYDKQDRVTETGQVQWNNCAAFADQPLYTTTGGVTTKTAPPNACACENDVAGVWTYCMPVSQTNFYNDSLFNIAIRTKPRTQVVATVYDQEFMDLSTITGMSRQVNLRARVAANMYYESVGTGVPGAGYTHATHYSYDATGNVATLVQDFPDLESVHSRYKRVDYEYDLHSGKVNMLAYNRSWADQFYQRYTYDADNRITLVETSHDGYIWKRDAGYTYYQHGPLARVSVGDQRVQGLDYAYTIQGWLKSINGGAIDSTLDMGADGNPATTITPKDAFATEINYFPADYEAITHNGNTAPFTAVPHQSHALYNGNIARQSTDLAPFGALTTDYTYDQMNRIRKAQYAQLTAGTLAFNNWYASAYKYDQDGNLLALTRNAGDGTLMDSLKYGYDQVSPYETDNKLVTLLEYASFNRPGYTDLQYFVPCPTCHVTSRFEYDAIGQLIRDNTAPVDTINWNIYGKTTDVSNSFAGTTPLHLHFAYDGMGQRVSKQATTATDSGRIENNTYYVRDGGGNILAEYNLTRAWDTGGKVQTIKDIYANFDPTIIDATSTRPLIWFSILHNMNYFDDAEVAGNLLKALGDSVPNHPAGYWLSRDAALTSAFFSNSWGLPASATATRPAIFP